MSGKPWRVTEVLCHRAWLSYKVCEEGANLKSWALWLPSYDHFPCAALSMHCPCISMPPHPRSPWHQNHPSFSMCLEAPGLNLHHEAKPLPWPHAVHISPKRRSQIWIQISCNRHRTRPWNRQNRIVEPVHSSINADIGLNSDLSSKKMLWVSFEFLRVALPWSPKSTRLHPVKILCIDVSIKVHDCCQPEGENSMARNNQYGKLCVLYVFIYIYVYVCIICI